MCVFDANKMACDCCEWGKFRAPCANAKPCGKKLIGMQRWHLDERCKICQQIWVKKASIQKKEKWIQRQREKYEKRRTAETSQALVEKGKIPHREQQIEKSGSNEWEEERLRGEVTKSEDGDSLWKGSTGEPRRSMMQIMLSRLSCHKTMDEEPPENLRCDLEQATTSGPVEKRTFGMVVVNYAIPTTHPLEALVNRREVNREASIKKIEGEVFFLRRDIERLQSARDEKRANPSLSYRHHYEHPSFLHPLPKPKVEPRDENQWARREPVGTLDPNPRIFSAYNPGALVNLGDGYFLAALEEADTATHTSYLLRGEQETSRAARLPLSLRRKLSLPKPASVSEPEQSPL